MRTMFCLLPYDKGLIAVRTNDDGTYSMRSWIGTFEDEFGPRKRRFDLRQSKPYITTNDFEECDRVIKKIKEYCLADDLHSVGFNYAEKKLYENRQFIQAGFNDKGLFILTTRKDYTPMEGCD